MVSKILSISCFLNIQRFLKGLNRDLSTDSFLSYVIMLQITGSCKAYTKLDSLKRLVTGNAYYVNETIARDPEAFTNLSQGQSPQVLWVGCADSRVPETTICHCKPGDIFVHRNIANTIHADDRNSASVVEYAVKYLKVEKIVVCGHTKCGGAMASLTNADLGETLNKWLQPLRE